MLASLANASARTGPASLPRSADTTAPSRIICRGAVEQSSSPGECRSREEKRFVRCVG